jgi:hypothetical protein
MHGELYMIKIACKFVKLKDLTKACKEAGITTLYQLYKVLEEKGVKNARNIYPNGSTINEDKFNEILCVLKELKK